MRVLTITALITAAGLAIAALGALVGAGHTERRIASACLERQESHIGVMYFECLLAPGSREVR